jgi:hypothetical protein
MDLRAVVILAVFPGERDNPGFLDPLIVWDGDKAETLKGLSLA